MNLNDKIFWIFSFGFIVLIFIQTKFFLNPYVSVLDSYISFDKKVNLSGILVEEPEIKEGNQRLIVLITENSLRKEKIKILIKTNLEENFKYGDKINFRGQLEKPKNFITDQGKQFDYINYLRKDGVFYISNYPKIKIQSSGNGNIIKTILFSWKQKFLNNINLPTQEKFLLGGLILGERANFSKDFHQKLIDTGTIHIIALSGFNMTIIASFVKNLFGFFSRNLNAGISIMTIILFVVMTGGNSTAIRAGIMASIKLISIIVGRTYNVARALMITIILMILFNPLILAHDQSFQLSVLSTIAVIFFTPRIEKYFLWLTSRWNIRDIVSMTFSAYIFVLPFILYNMGVFSLVAIPANLLILPFIPITMLFGFTAGLIYFLIYLPGSIIFSPFINLFNFLSFLLLNYEISIINYFSSFSLSSFTITKFPLWLTIAIYIYLFYLVLKQKEVSHSSNI